MWRINNNTGASANFTDPTLAIANASVLSGDTLHIEPSTTQYSMGVVSKALVFIGPGYLLDPGANGNAGLQADTRTARISNFTVTAAGGTVQVSNPGGTGCIFRNNVVKQNFGATLGNFYIANNIFINGATNYNNTFTGSNVKNNLFNSTVQTFPVGATSNTLGITEAATFAASGSSDARYVLKAGSPAIGAGVTVGSVVTPDAGAYGGPDPYKLSGIPSVPTIYSITVPASIPQGQATMNVTFSTRSNN